MVKFLESYSLLLLLLLLRIENHRFFLVPIELNEGRGISRVEYSEAVTKREEMRELSLMNSHPAKLFLKLLSAIHNKRVESSRVW